MGGACIPTVCPTLDIIAWLYRFVKYELTGVLRSLSKGGEGGERGLKLYLPFFRQGRGSKTLNTKIAQGDKARIAPPWQFSQASPAGSSAGPGTILLTAIESRKGTDFFADTFRKRWRARHYHTMQGRLRLYTLALRDKMRFQKNWGKRLTPAGGARAVGAKFI